MAIKHEAEIGGKVFSMETGKLAEQADGAVVVRYGDTVVLATAVASKEPREGADFFPLTVDYEERMYAAGKIPGGFIKRESRPSEAAILAMRLTDRPIRPLFPKGYRNDVQVVLTVLSTDQENDPDILAINGASAALSMSHIPFLGPIGAVRVGYVDGQFITNPTISQLDESQLDLVVAGTRDAVMHSLQCCVPDATLLPQGVEKLYLSTQDDQDVDYVILGVGVNVNIDHAALVHALGPAGEGATSLREAAGRRIDRNAFAAAFLNHLEKWDDTFRIQGPEAVLAGWRRRDALAGRPVEIRNAGQRLPGRARVHRMRSL